MFQSGLIEEHPGLIIENGSYQCRVGVASKEGIAVPQCCIQSVVGIPKNDPDQLLYGQDAIEKISSQQNNKEDPIILEYVKIEDTIKWNYLEKIWEQAFSLIGVDPCLHNILITDSPTLVKGQREKVCDLLFEHFDAPAIQMAYQEVLALASTGRLTGLVVNSGQNFTNVLPIFDGNRSPISGRICTEQLVRLLYEVNLRYTSTAGFEVVRGLKEKYCHVALNYNAEMQNPQAVQCQLPDKTCVTLTDQTFRVPEVLFQPMLVGKEVDGIHKMTHKSVTSSDIDLRRELIANIVLAGGSTMYQGFPERLLREIQDLVPCSMRVKVQDAPERQLLAWNGANVQIQINQTQSKWVQRQEYNEIGSSIVLRKFF